MICLQYLLPDYWYLWLSFLIFFFLFVSKCQFSTFSFPISHLCSPLPRYYVILSNQQKNWRGWKRQLHSIHGSQWMKGLPWLSIWLSCIFPFTAQGIHVSHGAGTCSLFSLVSELSSPSRGASAPTRVQVLLFSWWIDIGACLVPSLSCVWSHNPTDSQL